MPWILVILAASYLGYMFYSEHTKQKQEDTKQAAIENPAEKKAEVIERVITRTVTKEGRPIIITKEIIKTVSEKKPHIPHDKNQSSEGLYISGTYGLSLGGDQCWGVGTGWNISRTFSTGIRYDTIGPEQRIAIEMRINF